MNKNKQMLALVLIRKNREEKYSSEYKKITDEVKKTEDDLIKAQSYLTFNEEKQSLLQEKYCNRLISNIIPSEIFDGWRCSMVAADKQRLEAKESLNDKKIIVKKVRCKADELKEKYRKAVIASKKLEIINDL